MCIVAFVETGGNLVLVVHRRGLREIDNVIESWKNGDIYYVMTEI